MLDNINKSFAVVTLNDDQRQKPFIFECPNWELRKGDNVIVDTIFGQQEGKVVAVKNYANDEDLALINALNKNRPIKRVLAKFTIDYKKFADYYREQEEKEQKAREEALANAAAEEVSE